MGIVARWVLSLAGFLYARNYIFKGDLFFMITVTKAEAKMIRKMFPKAHMSKTVHHIMVDEVKDILNVLPNNVDAQAALAEMEHDEKRRTARTFDGEVSA